MVGSYGSMRTVYFSARNRKASDVSWSGVDSDKRTETQFWICVSDSLKIWCLPMG